MIRFAIYKLYISLEGYMCVCDARRIYRTYQDRRASCEYWAHLSR